MKLVQDRSIHGPKVAPRFDQLAGLIKIEREKMDMARDS